MERKNMIIMLTVVIIAIVGIGMWGMQDQTATYSDFTGSWQLLIYPTDMSDAEDDLDFWVTLYTDGESGELALAQDDENVIGNFQLVRSMYQNRYVYQKTVMNPGSNFRINMTEMHRWHFRVMAGNGTQPDFVNPGNNVWNGTLHLEQHMNSNMWTNYGEDTNWRYGLKYSYGGYTVELQFEVE